MTKNEKRDLAMAHWEYTKGIFESCLISQAEIDRLEYIYMQAFLHGWKHAEEAQEGK